MISPVIQTVLLLVFSVIRKQSALMSQIAAKRARNRAKLWEMSSRNRRVVKPGRGVAELGVKMPYRAKRLKNRYAHLRDDCEWFNPTVHMNVADFDSLHQLVSDEINTPLDPYNRLTPQQRSAMRRKRKKLTSAELLFVYLELLSGGTSGTDSVMKIATKYGLSSGTVWNYVYHTGWACFRALSAKEPLTWPTAGERAAMKGLLKGFPDAVMFLDGTRQKIVKSGDDDTQNDQYFGKDKMHCYALLIYVDVYGLIRRVEVSYSGRLHDKTMFQMSDVYLRRSEYFPEDESMIYDAGFVGAGDPNWIIIPFKKGTGLDFALKKQWYRDVRQRFRNEMAIGYVKNRNRAFIGCWTLAEELFTVSINVASMIINWKLRCNGIQIVPIERIQNMSDAE